MLETISFLLAVMGYVGLTATAVSATFGPVGRWAWRGVAFVILVHVSLVWAVRYEFQISRATRNGYTGFLLFHSALVAILVSLVVPERWRRRLIWGSFVVVTAGAIGATFRYDEVAVYRVPVLVCAVLGLGSLAWRFFTTRSPAGLENS